MCRRIFWTCKSYDEWKVSFMYRWSVVHTISPFTLTPFTCTLNSNRLIYAILSRSFASMYLPKFRMDLVHNPCLLLIGTFLLYHINEIMGRSVIAGQCFHGPPFASFIAQNVSKYFLTRNLLNASPYDISQIVDLIKTDYQDENFILNGPFSK